MRQCKTSTSCRLVCEDMSLRSSLPRRDHPPARTTTTAHELGAEGRKRSEIRKVIGGQDRRVAVVGKHACRCVRMSSCLGASAHVFRTPSVPSETVCTSNRFVELRCTHYASLSPQTEVRHYSTSMTHESPACADARTCRLCSKAIWVRRLSPYTVPTTREFYVQARCT